MFGTWRAQFGKPLKAEAHGYQAAKTFDQYVSLAPSLQNAVDLVPGWSTALPPEYGVRAGAMATYEDHRIRWALDQYGSAQDCKVLELGPLEGGHTLMLERAGATVDAVEANQLAFMRCLIVKEICGMKNARFWLGDFQKWLEEDRRYDFIVASGVLYHMNDPLRLLELIAARTDAVFFWTHVMDDKDMPADDPRRLVFAATPETRDFHGASVRCWRRSYLNAPNNPAFCGGLTDEHRWLDRADLMNALNALGFSDVRTYSYEPGHQFGPALSIFARK